MRIQLAALFVCAPALLGADWKPADNPLTTPWTSKVTSEHALPEYPRPQLVRTRCTNLNGLWDYAIRPKTEDRPAEFDGKPDWAVSYEAGLAAFRTRDFKAAIAAFENVLEIRDDAASSAMIERCRQQLENPDGEDWDGTTVAQTK